MRTLILELALSLAVSLQPQAQVHVTDRDLAIYQSVLRWNAEENLHGVARINLVRRHTVAINDVQIKNSHVKASLASTLLSAAWLPLLPIAP